MYPPTYPTNRKKIKCLAVERGRRRAFWSSASCPNIPVYPRSEEARTLPNQFLSKPPPLILFPAGLIQPWPGVISVVHPPKKSPLPQRSRRCSPPRLCSTTPTVPLSRLFPAGFRFESRARRPPSGKGARIKGWRASSSLFENLECYYSFRFAIRGLYTPADRTIVQTVWNTVEYRGMLFQKRMVDRLAPIIIRN